MPKSNKIKINFKYNINAITEWTNFTAINLDCYDFLTLFDKVANSMLICPLMTVY